MCFSSPSAISPSLTLAYSLASPPSHSLPPQLAALLLRLNFMASALTIMMSYVWARRNPHSLLAFMNLFVFRAPYLPWVLLLLSVLAGSDITADLAGIFTGHMYYYLEDVFPNLVPSRVRLLKTPRWLRKLLGQKPRSGGAGRRRRRRQRDDADAAPAAAAGAGGDEAAGAAGESDDDGDGDDDVVLLQEDIPHAAAALAAAGAAGAAAGVGAGASDGAAGVVQLPPRADDDVDGRAAAEMFGEWAMIGRGDVDGHVDAGGYAHAAAAVAPASAAAGAAVAGGGGGDGEGAALRRRAGDEAVAGGQQAPS